MNVERFWAQTRKDGQCLIWTGHEHKGYGRYGGRGAHRVAFEIAKGPIPSGLEIHHECERPLCINPEHLSAVSRMENMARRYFNGTHCHKGHELTERNTYVNRHGWRQCRTCQRETVRRYRKGKGGGLK